MEEKAANEGLGGILPHPYQKEIMQLNSYMVLLDKVLVSAWLAFLSKENVFKLFEAVSVIDKIYHSNNATATVRNELDKLKNSLKEMESNINNLSIQLTNNKEFLQTQMVRTQKGEDDE